MILEYCKSPETQRGAFKISSMELVLNVAQLLHPSSRKLEIMYGYRFTGFRCVFNYWLKNKNFMDGMSYGGLSICN